MSSNPHVVVDYAHTPDALERTLRTAKRLCKGRLTVVFGAGGHRDRQKRPMWGRAAREADRIVLTSDNPRDEDPADIVNELREGVGDHEAVEEVLDRTRAIERALDEASGPDVVFVAGKGHETHQDVAGVHRAFSDVDVIRAFLRK